MPLEVKKQNRENAQSLVRRFSRRVKQSGILNRVRRNRYRKRIKSENMQKRSALRKGELRIQHNLEEKMEKPDKNPRNYRR
ncbi:MAG: hypothetical protein NT148_01805 [Candidatus Nealsonbacteria bacterium]|nr:hypothetical protein [Candidatus Nealsonbacteria bacterium]